MGVPDGNSDARPDPVASGSTRYGGSCAKVEQGRWDGSGGGAQIIIRFLVQISNQSTGDLKVETSQPSGTHSPSRRPRLTSITSIPLS